jgi:iron complex transport system ATP-binding protein
MTSITARDVRVSFDEADALKGASLVVGSGAWIGLIGPNGAGKSTLLRAVAGLLPYSGAIDLDGEPVAAMPRRVVARLVSFVPQTPSIPRAMSVADFALMGRTPYIPYLGTESAADIDVVHEVLARLELVDLAARLLGTLSGGELQRAVLARALSQEAPILLLDEPTNALDVGHMQQVLELVDSLRRERELTVVSAMHDLTLAGQFAERLVLLDGGRTVASGSAREVLTEAIITRHYGASVRVADDGHGGVVVVPTRIARVGRTEPTSPEPTSTAAS